MVDGIVLAAGYSSRAATNKMIFEYRHRPMIISTIETMHAVCDRVIVVTGHHHDELVPILECLDYVKIVYNQNYSQGMFTSIKRGVLETDNDFFIVPGDYPVIKASTYYEILESTGRIRVPSFNHRLGHPIFFEKEFKTLLLDTKESNLKDFRNKYDFEIIEIEDPGILQDIDDESDYLKLIGKG